jgi:hypothetical protein
MKYDHIMLDLETLSTRADAIIVSIGAVKFNMTGEMDEIGFYAVCDLHQPGRHFSPDTLAWWMTQSDEARAVFSDKNAITLNDALTQLSQWADRDDYKMWSNGANFDIPIINHAFDTQFVPRATKHWNEQCYRTMKNLYKSVPLPEFKGVKHNALADAAHQARHLQDIHKFMTVGPSKGFAKR